MSVRDELHELAARLQSQSAPFDARRLNDADKKWQQWLLAHTQKNYEMTLRRDDKPKSQWWWWVDKLSELSEEDRATT